MRNLLAATCLTPVILVGLASPAAADTTITKDTSTPIRTSTVANGSADNVIIDSGTKLTPTSGAAITIDSNNSVTQNGTITINDKDDVTGIAASSGLTGTISNTGTITLGETTTDTTTDSNGGVDGPFAVTSGKAGIHVSGTGTFTGNITNSGTIAVTGNTSSGISVDGTLTGNLSNSGSITITGNNSVGLQLHKVNGAVSVFGTITSQGQNNVAIALDGDVSGLVALEGTVTNTGYRYTTVPTDLTTINADDLLQSKAAVSISGSAGGGVLLEVTPTASDTNTDVDGDGIADTDEGTASITSYGSAPALQIGSSSQAISLGKVAGTSDGLVIRGTVLGTGLYSGVSATGIQLGGLGHDVTIAGGVDVSGTVTATSNGGSSTALIFGSGTSAPVLTNSGTISATGSTGTSPTLVAVRIDSGASVPELDNSGTISASLANTTTGTATAILDTSGTLKTINNTGTIFGTLTGSTDASATNGYALNLAANTSGVTFTQSLSTADDALAPELAGRIVTGSGTDSFSVSAGTVNGATSFGAGNDALALSGTAAWTGDTDFGSGKASLSLAGTSSYTGDLTLGDGAATITLNDSTTFTGAITTGSGALSLDVVGGRFSLTNTTPLALASLNVGSSGIIGVTIDPATGAHTEYDVSGTASFASGSTLSVALKSLLQTSTTYTVVNAGTLSGGANVGIDTASLPFLYSASAGVGTNGHSLDVTLDRKTASELGLNRAEGQAYNGIYAAIGQNSDLSNSFLSITDGDSFVSTYRQLMPITSDGIFQSVLQGSRAVARAAADPDGLRIPVGAGPISVWLQEAAWHDNRSRDSDSDGYKITGNGFTAGAEAHLGGFGSAGLAGSYIVNDVDQTVSGAKMFGYQYEGTAYWRATFGRLHANAHVSYATIAMKERREFQYTVDGDSVDFNNSDRWHGDLMTAGGGADYRIPFGHFDLTPTGRIDYYRLHENGHSEAGDAATALTIDGRTSDEFVGTGTAVLGYGLGKEGSSAGWARFEVEGGWREIIGGSLGDTVAHFQDGDDFTITGDKLTSGYVGRIRAIGGNAGLRIAGEVSAERLQNTTALAGRVSLRVNF